MHTGGDRPRQRTSDLCAEAGEADSAGKPHGVWSRVGEKLPPIPEALLRKVRSRQLYHFSWSRGGAAVAQSGHQSAPDPKTLPETPNHRQPDIMSPPTVTTGSTSLFSPFP